MRQKPQQKRRLIHLLSDGLFHSGTALGHALGVSRSAVWKEMQALSAEGLEVHAVTGRGYRLTHPVEPLHEGAIRAALSKSAQYLLGKVEILDDTDSTNLYLMRQAACGAPGGTACLAERQRAGRGRHGRTWVSPPGGNIYLSLLWRFTAGPGTLGGASLAVAVAVMRALHAAGLPTGPQGAGLKWPNDILWHGRKLAGILLDMAGESSGPCHLVAGVGLNMIMPAPAARLIDQPWIDVHALLDPPPSRNLLAGLLLQHLLLALHEFQRHGLAPFMAEWKQLDLIAGKRVALNLAGRNIHGIAQGVANDGALKLLVNGAIQRYYSGEVSVRELA